MPLKSVERFRNTSKDFGLSLWNVGFYLRLPITTSTLRGRKAERKDYKGLQFYITASGPSNWSARLWNTKYFISFLLKNYVFLKSLLGITKNRKDNAISFQALWHTISKHRKIHNSQHTTLIPLPKFTTEAVKILCLSKVSDGWQHQITGNLIPKSIKYTWIFCWYSN